MLIFITIKFANYYNSIYNYFELTIHLDNSLFNIISNLYLNELIYYYKTIRV